MKITLENFKCYTNQTFDIGEKGLILISGPSGAGKSSILCGIFFCLFGSGTDIVKDGAKNCKVILEMDDYTIIRSKRPNKLIMIQDKNEYHDDDAQERINKIYGNLFETTGYISQDYTSSFVLMNPSDKLEFLENFIFRDIDISEKKNRCKAIIKQRSEELLLATSRLEVETRIFNEMEKPETLSFPIKCSIQMRDKFIKNENIKLKNSIIRIKKAESEILKISKDISHKKQYEIFEKSKRDEINKKKVKIDSMKDEMSSIVYKGDDFLETIKNKLSYISRNREYINLKTQYEQNVLKLKDMKDCELNEMHVKLASLKNTEEDISSIREGIKENDSIIDEIKEFNRLYDTLIKKYDISNVNEKLLKEREKLLESIITEIEKSSKRLSILEIEKSLYTCPSCDSKLSFTDGKLEMLKIVDFKNEDLHCEESKNYEKEYDLLNDKIKELSKNKRENEKYILELKHKLNERKNILEKVNLICDNYIEREEPESNYEISKEVYNAINDILSDSTSEISRLKDLQSKYIRDETIRKDLTEKIDNNVFNSSIIKFEKNIKDSLSSINKLGEQVNEKFNEKFTESEEDLISELNEQKQYKTTISMLLSNISSFESEIKEILNEISSKEHCIKDIKSIKELENDLESTHSILNENIEIKKEKEKLILDIEAFLENEKKVKKYNEWYNKIEVLKKEETIIRNKLSSINILKEKIIEAESIALTNVINSINNHTQIYLDEFFPTIPITVRLLPFKETQKKTSKPCINMEVEYKGMSCSLSRLSGGQKSRIVLAYTLALADIFNLPLIMIDECTSSLDEELNNIVMESLKQHFENKLILVISHQSVEGHFDNIINLTEKFD
jgi:exonuclease SbcC